MKVKLKHRLRDGRIVEIEGEPKDVVHTAHELDKMHVVEAEKQSGIRPSQSVLGAVSGERVTEGKRKIRTRDVVEFIYSLEKPEMKHTVKDLMIRFFGRVLPSQDSHSGYLTFYNMIVRAHDDIKHEKNGEWEGQWITDLEKGGRYRVYRFVQK
jgi:hypothetical protein